MLSRFPLCVPKIGATSILGSFDSDFVLTCSSCSDSFRLSVGISTGPSLLADVCLKPFIVFLGGL